MTPQQMVDCINACTNCHTMCARMVTHCLTKGGQHASPAHIRHLLDCAQICATSADFMNRGSHLHTETCRACSVVCDHCAESCQKMNDDPHMQHCIDACRKCAELCRGMAGAAK